MNMMKQCVLGLAFLALTTPSLFGYYDPTVGRFLNRDPIEENGGINLYAYCQNDPINLIDYLGLAGYFFDGTANHPYPLNYDGTKNYKTNVRILFESYIGEASYACGIGSGYHADSTPYTASERKDVKIEVMTGKTMFKRVAYMIRELEKNLDKGDKVIDLVGFSRGAASATLFLNLVQEKINSGDPRYKGIQVRFVALFDQVPSHRSLAGQLWGRGWDTLGYAFSFTCWSPDTYARNANNYGFNLPLDMKFSNQPIHLVALDEQRKEFAVSNLNLARQVGFRGVHSNLGGGYGGSLFEFIAREFVIETAKGYGLNLFKPAIYKSYDGRHRKIYNHYMNNFSKGGLPKIYLDPTDNSQLHFNDNEPRHLPWRLEMHPSVSWFGGSPYNSIK